MNTTAARAVIWAAGKAVRKDARAEAEVYEVAPCGAGTCSGSRRADVVFVHGIGGHAQWTWTAENGFFWPEHIAAHPSLADVRVLTVAYPTSLHALDAVAEMKLSERAHNIRDKLRHAKVGERPVVFVCHSMGGLIMKQVLVDLAARRDTEPLWQNLVGIVFFATPHEGSNVASVLKHLGELVSEEVHQLSQEEWGPLDDLHGTFIDHVTAQRSAAGGAIPRLHGFYEQLRTQNAVAVVSKRSATRDMDNGRSGGIPGDHEKVVKPTRSTDSAMANTLELLESWLTLQDEPLAVPSQRVLEVEALADVEEQPEAEVMDDGRERAPSPDRRWPLLVALIIAIGVIAALSMLRCDPPEFTYCAEPIANLPEHWRLTLRGSSSARDASALRVAINGSAATSVAFRDAGRCIITPDNLEVWGSRECSLLGANRSTNVTLRLHPSSSAMESLAEVIRLFASTETDEVEVAEVQCTQD